METRTCSTCESTEDLVEMDGGFFGKNAPFCKACRTCPISGCGQIISSDEEYEEHYNGPMKHK